VHLISSASHLLSLDVFILINGN